MDKTEKQLSILAYLNQQDITKYKDSMMNTTTIFNLISNNFDVSVSTLWKWYKENDSFKKGIDIIIMQSWRFINSSENGGINPPGW